MVAGLTKARRALAAGWFGLLCIIALGAPFLPFRYAPDALDLLHVSTSPAEGMAQGHWLGTAPLGRDVLANLVFGARTVLLVTVPAALFAAALGALIGGTAGYWGRSLRAARPLWLLVAGMIWWALALPPPEAGLVMGSVAMLWLAVGLARRRQLATWPVPLDYLLQSVGAGLATVPALLLVVAISSGDALSTTGLVALLALTGWAGAARLVRAETLRVRVQPFVEAARALGMPHGRIWLRHVLPFSIRPLRTDLPLNIAALIGLETTLSFLGLGLAPDVASWGHLLSAARIDLNAWWTAAAPIAVLLLTTDALRVLAGSKPPTYQG